MLTAKPYGPGRRRQGARLAAVSDSPRRAPSRAWFREPVLQTLVLDAALAEAVGALRRVGIEPLLIKGPATARALYDDPSERAYGDIDLVVSSADVPPSRRVLEDLGYSEALAELRPSERPLHAGNYRRGNALIDLHWRLSMTQGAEAYPVLIRDAGTLPVAGVEASVPSPAATALIAGLHAAQHGDSPPTAREDLRRAIERIDGADWRTAASLAAELGAGPALRAGLLGVPGGAALANRLALPNEVPVTTRLRGRRAVSAVRFDRFRRTEGWRGRLILVANTLFPSPAYMREFVPLAARGRLGLLAAYALRIPWLAGRGARGGLVYAREALAPGRK